MKEDEYIRQEDDIVQPADQETIPWSQPILYIFWGYILSYFTLNFLYLQYLLPTIGVILLYLGFHSFRRENRWFYISWILVAIKLILHFIQLILNATPINIFKDGQIVLPVILVAYQITLILIFRSALRTVYKKADLTENHDPLLSVAIWTIIIAVCTMTPLIYSWILIIAVLFFCLMIILSFYLTANDLNRLTYSFNKPCISKMQKVNALIYFLSCLIFVAVSCIYFNHIQLEEVKRVPIARSYIREKLMKLGFPENVLLDIADNDLEMLDDVILIDSFEETLEFNSPQLRTNYSYHKTGVDRLYATTVYLEMPDNLVYVFVHFNWKDKKAYWQDGFTIWGDESIDLLNGTLLYEKDSEEFYAPIPRIKCEEVTSYSMFVAEENRQISGAVNYPFGSNNQRGYVLYQVQLPEEQWITNNIMNYVHHSHPFQYPYKRTEELMLRGTYSFNDTLKQHYTLFEMQAFRDAN